MALERNPNDPFNEDPAANDLRRSTRLDQELQDSPELSAGGMSAGRVAAAVVAVLVLIGAVFYGMNMSANAPTSTATPSTPAATQDNAQNTPAVRDVTPNRDAGTTTGSAPSGSAATGSTPTTPAPALPQSPASPPTDSGTTPSR